MTNKQNSDGWWGQWWHVLVAMVVFIVSLCAAWGLFGIPDIWKNVFVVIVSAAATYVIIAVVSSMQQKQQKQQMKDQAQFQSELLKKQSEISEEKEKSIQMYQNKLDAFSEFSKELWSKADFDYLDLNGVRALLFNKVIFFMTISDVDKLIKIFDDLPSKTSNVNKIELFSGLTEVIKKCLDSNRTDIDSETTNLDKNKIGELWRSIDKYIEKDESKDNQHQMEPVSSTQINPIEPSERKNINSIEKFEYKQAWHFAMLGDEQLDVIGDGKINELSLIEYEEEWRTNLVKQVQENDVVFLFRRGGYGYIGAFRPKGWRIFGYDDDEKLYETIHLFGEEDVIVKEEASVNSDVEKYDIYGSIKDSADFCTNLIVEPIYYLGHESGTNPGGVYRRTISRYDAGYAATLLEWFRRK